MLLNDGSEEQKTLAGTPDFKVFKTEERNLKSTVDLVVPLQFVRFIEVKQLVRGEWEIDEFDTLAVPGGVSAMWVDGALTSWPPGTEPPSA